MYKRMLVVHHCTSMFRALKQNLCCMFSISRLAVCESTRKSCSVFQITGHRKLRCRQRRRTQLWRLMLQLGKRVLVRRCGRRAHGCGLGCRVQQRQLTKVCFIDLSMNLLFGVALDTVLAPRAKRNMSELVCSCPRFSLTARSRGRRTTQTCLNLQRCAGNRPESQQPST